MWWVIVNLLTFVTSISSISEVQAMETLPGETIAPSGIYMPFDGTITITATDGVSLCNEGAFGLYSPTIRWPDGRITDQVLIENYGAVEEQPVTFGPYAKGTSLVFEFTPISSYCEGPSFLSIDRDYAAIQHHGDGMWTINWEDSTNPGNLDFDDVYLSIKANPVDLSTVPPAFIEEIRPDEYTQPQYKLPWCKGESHQVWQLPKQGSHRFPFVANAYDFGGEFAVCAPEDGRILWVEDSFGNGGCNADLRAETNVIVLKTADDTQVTLVHLKKGSARVKIGDWVEQGQKLATSGNSGYTCGTHLHLEFQQACHSLDDMILLARLIEEQRRPQATLAWSCPTKKPFSDGFWISGQFHERLEQGSWYESDNQR